MANFWPFICSAMTCEKTFNLLIKLNQFTLIDSIFRPNAKLLWKRIPNNIKSENKELSHIWEIGVKLWNRELPAIYPLLSAYEWPNHLKNVMKCIGGLPITNLKVYLSFLMVVIMVRHDSQTCAHSHLKRVHIY